MSSSIIRSVLKFTYLFLINFFLLRAVSLAMVREELGGLSSCLPFCVSWGSPQVERFANSDFFSLSLLFWDRVSP